MLPLRRWLRAGFAIALGASMPSAACASAEEADTVEFGSVEKDASAEAPGAGGTGTGACSVQFCPSGGPGTPCCITPGGPCGVDLGMGCAPPPRPDF